MKTMRFHPPWVRIAVILGIAAGLFAGCSGDHGGPTTGILEVKLTDAPGDVLELVVTIDRLSVKTDSGSGFEQLDLNTDIGVGGAVIDKDVARHRLTID